VGVSEFPNNEQELISAVPAMFKRFDEHENLLSNCLRSRAWSEVWISGRHGWRESVQQAVKNGDLVDGEKAKQIGAVVQLLFSGVAWKALKDHCGLTGDEASHAVMTSIRALMDELHANGKR
jgi:hypothetical protein